MQPMFNGCTIAGRMWSFRSEASDDLNSIYDMLSDIPRCDTKKEILSLIKRSYAKLNEMECRIKEAGTDYLLNDYDGDDL